MGKPVPNPGVGAGVDVESAQVAGNAQMGSPDWLVNTTGVVLPRNSQRAVGSTFDELFLSIFVDSRDMERVDTA